MNLNGILEQRRRSCTAPDRLHLIRRRGRSGAEHILDQPDLPQQMRSPAQPRATFEGARDVGGSPSGGFDSTDSPFPDELIATEEGRADLWTGQRQKEVEYGAAGSQNKDASRNCTLDCAPWRSEHGPFCGPVKRIERSAFR